LFGLESNTNNLYLIDLGFCKRYVYNGKHIDEKNEKHIIGSPNFVSVNVHNGLEPSRRDDIESCIYVILNMLVGPLEWFNKNITLNEICILKTEILLYEDLPSFIKIMLHYTRSMKFEEEPDYDYLINLMVTVFNENRFNNDTKYEWNC
jgi:serine/threonine protein kinase